MTNMKERLRAHRDKEPKVKLQSKSKSINAKAKEKLTLKNHVKVNELIPEKSTRKKVYNQISKDVEKSPIKNKIKAKDATIIDKSPGTKNVKENISPPAKRVSLRKNSKCVSTADTHTSDFSSKVSVLTEKSTAKNISKENIPEQLNITKRNKSNVISPKNGFANKNTIVKKLEKLKKDSPKKSKSIEKKTSKVGNLNKSSKRGRKVPPTVSKPIKVKDEGSAIFNIPKKASNGFVKENGLATPSSPTDENPNSFKSIKIKVEISTHRRSDVQKLRPYICQECKKCFLCKNDLRKHSLIHAGLKPFVCEHCSKEFRQAVNLRNHISSQHSNVIENPIVYTCDHCGKTFLIKDRLRLHLRMHTGYKPYKCLECPMRFARIGQVKQHEVTHSGKRNFICEHCQAKFTCGAKLKMHIKGHFDIRDFTCYLCGKSFIRLDAIKKHLACFHNGEKPFKCPICKKSLKGHLQEHLRTHRAEKPHGCAECGSRFAQRSQLTVHKRKHSGARPYRCRVCWKAFAHSTALTLHIRHHTGEKPFECRICFGRFAQLPHLKKHMIFVHGDTRVYVHAPCDSMFNTKLELDNHLNECTLRNDHNESPEEKLSRQVSEAFRPVDPPMALTKMRLLLAVLLNKISSPKRLQKLGFNRRLIDEVLIESLESSGQKPNKDKCISAAERLKLNVQQFLEWTVPPHFMAKFRSEHKSTEELLEELTS